VLNLTVPVDWLPAVTEVGESDKPATRGPGSSAGGIGSGAGLGAGGGGGGGSDPLVLPFAMTSTSARLATRPPSNVPVTLEISICTLRATTLLNETSVPVDDSGPETLLAASTEASASENSRTRVSFTCMLELTSPFVGGL
jgi:hypothetical protein